MAEQGARMNLSNWNYFKPVGGKHFNKSLKKLVSHVERHDYVSVEVKPEQFEIRKKQKAVR